MQIDRTAWFKGGGFSQCEPTESPRNGPYRLILLGPPGVGKGTHRLRGVGFAGSGFAGSDTMEGRSSKREPLKVSSL